MALGTPCTISLLEGKHEGQQQERQALEEAMAAVGPVRQRHCSFWGRQQSAQPPGAGESNQPGPWVGCILLQLHLTRRWQWRQQVSGSRRGGTLPALLGCAGTVGHQKGSVYPLAANLLVRRGPQAGPLAGKAANCVGLLWLMFLAHLPNL